jgi:serine/threonine protein kinase
MSIKQIDGYKIKMNEKLGVGSYGTVYAGESDTTHKRVAIKILPKESSKC